ncbi:MAG: hypothetical protein N3C61_01275 [Candidatus Micrarchaeota archaeon]|nr:hypothetical protein [Candidatus Micrarchaeota archaeon]
MEVRFSDSLYNVMGIVIVISLLFMIILFAIGRLMNSREIEQTSQEETVEIGVSILMIGVISYLLTNPIQHFTCNVLINTVLEDNIDCSNPTSRELYMNHTFISLLNLSYYPIIESGVYNEMNKLLKSSMTSRTFKIFGSISYDAFQNDIALISNNIGNVGRSLGFSVGPEQEFRGEMFNMFSKWGDLGLSTGFSLIPCRHFGYFYDSLNNLIVQVNTYRSIIFTFRELFSPSLYPVFIVGFFSIGMIMRATKITRKVGGFLISFSIALSMLPIISVFLINLITDVNPRYNPNEISQQMRNFTMSIISNFPEPTRCYDLRLSMFEGMFKSAYAEISSPQSRIIDYSVYSMLIMLSLGLSLLAVISITVGINQILGIDVSPFVLSHIARVS